MVSTMTSSSARILGSYFRNAASKMFRSPNYPVLTPALHTSQIRYVAPCVAHRTFLSFRKDPPKKQEVTTFEAAVQLVRASSTSVANIYTSFVKTRYGRLMRLDKPIGTHLLFLPAAWSITLGAPDVTEWLRLTAIFYGGSILLRGAGCTINDIWDAEIDRQVSRTKIRPIASGEVSTTSAFMFMSAQMLGGLALLSQLNETCFPIAVFSVFPVMFYPFAKKKTAYPQAVLGLTMNAGALLGYAAATGGLSTESLLFYGAGWCWTMVYDCIYAFQDKEDDTTAGVSSTAITFGNHPKLILGIFTAGKLALLTTVGLSAGLSWPYYVCASASSLHLGYQVAFTDLSDNEQCRRSFESNSLTGAITWLGVILSRLV